MKQKKLFYNCKRQPEEYSVRIRQSDWKKLKVINQGRVKDVGGENVNEITGEYSWTSPEGELVSFTYTADENGYQAQGSHLPEAPPLHPHIQLGLELIARANRNNRKRA